jgi:hypothetical protein
MNCADFEKLIALEVEGDLPKQMAGGVAAHLRTCRQCQEFALDLETSQDLLKELGKEAPNEVTLQNIRRGILNRLPTEPAPITFPAWPFALGAAAITILLLALALLGHRSRTPAPKVVAERETPAASTQVGGRTHIAGPAPSKAAPRGSATTPAIMRAVAPRPAFHRISRGTKAAAKPGQSHRASEFSRERPQHPEPLMVKLLTDNPNVVIYWLVD